ncbi:helix-turn-helix domain-containing protein [Virgibacillus pantothenticus]
MFFYRKKNKLTQAVLAKGICSISYYIKIETGQITPSSEIIRLLAI